MWLMTRAVYHKRLEVSAGDAHLVPAPVITFVGPLAQRQMLGDAGEDPE